MAIKDLQPRQGKVDITVEVIEVSEAREFEKFGKKGRVASAKVKDDSGEITLTLWNEQVDQVKPGMTVKITNGYVGEYQGEMQLTTGKFGQLEVSGEAKPAEQPKEEKPKEELPEKPVTEEENIG